jgi:predicted secreted protein
MRKRFLVSLLFLVLLLVCLPGCGGKSGEAYIEVTCSEFKEQANIYRELEVPEGSTFTVTLCASATSGFLWSKEVGISNGAVVSQLEHGLKGKGMLDASSEEMWTFQALSAGNCTINLQYSRPWEIDSDQQKWTLDLLVVVK